jgi:pimeloyl-ACP methyl ester carboxylesterase
VLRAFCDGTVFGACWGVDPPRVVALHGWGRTHLDFAASLGPASGGRTAPAAPLSVVALDLPGFGASPPPPAPWGSADYAEVVAGVMAELGSTGDGTGSVDRPDGRPREHRMVLVGHSLGGRVALTLAATHPEMVTGLVLCGAPVAPRPPAARPATAYRVVRCLHRWGVVPEAVMERARQRHGSADYRSATGVLRETLVRLVNEDYRAAVAAVAAAGCPVELVWGDDDTAAPLDGARWLADRLPGARLTVCPGAGHLVPTTVPDQLRAAVDRLLASTARSH